ncbi:protein snail [Eurosta solidaginis]|uniref:protein snail n=1 Tax=Eurosta solidaginis TaxID=178769 RepID=UPI00353174E0
MLPALSSNNLHRLHLDSSSNTTAQQHGQHSAAHNSQQQQYLQQQQQHSTTKRNASMIFRIEHLLPSTSRGLSPAAITPITMPTDAAISTASGSSSPHATVKRSKLCAPFNGVLMSQFTPKDTHSEAIPTYALMNSNLNTLAEQYSAYCTISQDVLRMSSTLLRRIKLSEDIHSYNALFELQPGGGDMVHVRVVRDVARDEELVAWFGEEIALLMSIPFLTPLNIQGNKRYTCHLCHQTFETPNPLKIHLALGCGRHSMDILWIRLHYALKATSYTRQHRQLLEATTSTLSATHASLIMKQHTPPAAPSSTSSISPTTSPQPATLPQQSPDQQQQRQSHHHMTHPELANQRLQQTQHRFSAFKPVSPSIAFTSAITTSSFSVPNLHTTTVAATLKPATFSYLPPISSSIGGALPHMHLLHQAPGGMAGNPLNAAAQIEAIVSNMGASKQGHLCIYCGKVYSRKYGLKIHIRTHTGFKPLKCKFCMRPFGDPSNLNKHVRLHMQTNVNQTPIEGYQCTLCNKTLARRRDLQRHMESRHSGDGTSS